VLDLILGAGALQGTGLGFTNTFAPDTSPTGGSIPAGGTVVAVAVGRMVTGSPPGISVKGMFIQALSAIKRMTLKIELLRRYFMNYLSPLLFDNIKSVSCLSISALPHLSYTF
jgi:hypothetical protein